MRLTVGAEGAGERLDRFVAASFPRLSRALVMKYLKEGAARVNGRRARPGTGVREGDEIDLPDFQDAVRRIRGGKAEGVPAVARKRRGTNVRVLFEDEDLVAVDKPAGVVMHPGEQHEGEGLDRMLRERFGPSVRLVHRLDRDTSGVVVAARGHPRSARRLADAFKAGEVEKVYLALVRGRPDPPAGTVDAPVRNTRRAGESVKVDPEGDTARTDYETLEAFERFSWLRLRPRTGRRHQLRVHMAHLGHPLAVDRVYARCRTLRLSDLRPDLAVTWKDPVVLNRQPLHAAELTLRHPRTGEDLTLRAPLPPDLEECLRLLRGG